ncbi:MAG: site-2 protease family protein [Oscillospiraceae bacterium]|nr:site-2 protease family protein [Oscillospiraceae bacterium]
MDLVSIIVSVLVFSLVILVHELGHFITAKLSGIKVNEFSIGMGPQLLSKTVNDTVYSIRAFPIGGFVAMEGEDEESDAEGSFSSVPVQSRIAVVVAGAVMNMVLGFIVLCYLTASQDAITSRTVSSFYESAMTQQTGLMVDDEIIAINGRKCYIANDVIYEFARTQNGSADFTVIREGQKVELNDVTFDTYETEDGLKQMVIDFTVYPVETTFTNIVKESVNWTISIARLVFLSLVDLITGNVAINQMSGPVGIVSVVSEAVNLGIEPVLNILAMITINLGVFNLLPIPALDGGRLVFLLIELIRGKAVPQKYEILVNTAGMFLLLGFMVFVTFSDITKFFV